MFIYLSMCVCSWSLSIPFPLLVGAFKFRNDFEEFSNTEKKHVECWFWMILIVSYCQWLTSSNCHPETKSSLRKNDVFFWRLLVHHSISGGSMVDPVGHPSQAGIGHLRMTTKWMVSVSFIFHLNKETCKNLGEFCSYLMVWPDFWSDKYCYEWM